MSDQSLISGEKGGENNELILDALLGEMRKMLSAEMEQVHERMAKMEQSREPSGSNVVGQRTDRPYRKGMRMEEREDFDSGEYGFKRERENTQRLDSNLGSIKMKIPLFQGKNDP